MLLAVSAGGALQELRAQTAICHLENRDLT